MDLGPMMDSKRYPHAEDVVRIVPIGICISALMTTKTFRPLVVKRFIPGKQFLQTGAGKS